MKYKEIKPSVNFRDLVESYWCFELPDAQEGRFPVVHETLPYSSISIVLIQQPYYRGVRVQGPQTKKFNVQVNSPSIYVGIRFHPWVIFFPSLFDKRKLIDKTDAAPPLIQTLFESLLSKKMVFDAKLIVELEKRLSEFVQEVSVVENEIIKHICLQLSVEQSIARVTENLPFSIRVIQKKFKSVTGLSMKQHAGNIRQLNFWSDLLIEGSGKMNAILAQHFFDQAHFINDFKRKMKVSPSRFETYMRKIDIFIR